MQQVLIPSERLKILKHSKHLLEGVERLCKCKITIDKDDYVCIESEDAYEEFKARSIVFAYGRGFEMKVAEQLGYDDTYFASIDIGQLFGSEKRIKQMCARIIGENGRTRIYIENVSGAKLSVYGETISFIGSAMQIDEAKTAVSALLDGSTHKLAYSRMEAAHRRNKAQKHDPTF